MLGATALATYLDVTPSVGIVLGTLSIVAACALSALYFKRVNTRALFDRDRRMVVVTGLRHGKGHCRSWGDILAVQLCDAGFKASGNFFWHAYQINLVVRGGIVERINLLDSGGGTRLCRMAHEIAGFLGVPLYVGATFCDGVDDALAKIATTCGACGPCRGVRKRSEKTICGLPLYDIALGSDPGKGELRGHAHGIIAIGDFAKGWVAIGGLARGFVAIGGLAVGALSFGGLAAGGLSFGGLSLAAFAFGGLAVGGFAVGGCAVGVVAVGGCAAGYYAVGGAAFGRHVISATQQSPEAVAFFKQLLHFLRFE